MTKLMLSTKGILEIFSMKKISVTIDSDGRDFIVNIAKSRKLVLKLVIPIKQIDKSISESAELKPYRHHLRIARILRNTYRQLIREEIIDDLIPKDIAMVHAFVVDKKEKPSDWVFDNDMVIATIEARDNVYGEYKLLGVITSMLGTDEQIRENTIAIAATANIEMNLN